MSQKQNSDIAQKVVNVDDHLRYRKPVSRGSSFHIKRRVNGRRRGWIAENSSRARWWNTCG